MPGLLLAVVAVITGVIAFLCLLIWTKDKEPDAALWFFGSFGFCIGSFLWLVLPVFWCTPRELGTGPVEVVELGNAQFIKDGETAVNLNLTRGIMVPRNCKLMKTSYEKGAYGGVYYWGMGWPQDKYKVVQENQ